MKKILSLLAVAAISFSVFASDYFTFTPIKGDVKSYTQTDFSVASKFGNYYRTPVSKVTHVLNGTGREIESSEISPRDVVLDKIVYAYDSKGNLIEESCSDTEGNLIWKNVTTYKAGKKTDCSEYNAKGTLKAKIIYTYEGDNLTDESGYDGDGALVWKTIYKYDAAGQIRKIAQYNADGLLDSEEIYTFTEAGAIESIVTYDSFTDKTAQKIFRYANDALSEITTYNAASEVTNRVIFKYDAKGNPVKVTEYNIANKFGTTVNELISMSEIVYQY